MPDPAPDPDVDADNDNNPRLFLVVIDGSEEVGAALRFACRRARNTHGRVALLTVVEPPEFQHWMFVGRAMEDEARQIAEERLQAHAALIHTCVSDMPELIVREGDTREELFSLIEEDQRISVLVLAAGSGKDGPGPLVKAVTGKHAGQLRVPVTIVPGTLTDEQIDGLT
nr:universal stress protein [Roseospirillum parvum]